MPDVLVILAHHDDEFFLAPLIQDECAAGAALQVCYLTDGGMDGMPAGLRLGESRAVLAGLGVGAGQVADLGVECGISDGGLADRAGAALQALVRRHAARRFARIWLMAWEGGHADHDAAHMIGLAYADRCQPGARLQEFPLYNAYRAPPGRCQAMTLIPRPGSLRSERKLGEAEARACAQLMEAYPSQRHLFRALAPAIEWALCTRRSLQYRELRPRPDYALRPHAGPLFYEQTFPVSFDAFREKMRGLDAARSEGLEHHQQHDG